MRVLVTGAAGFVGQHLVRGLVADGAEVFAGALSADADGLSRAVPGQVTCVPLDVTSAESVAEAVARARPEAVYHLAGQASVGASFHDPIGTWEVNATGTLRLVQALAPGTRFLLAGSAEVYGLVPEAEQPISESRPLRPVTPYAASKAAAELVVMQAAATGRLRAVVARSFNHTGPGQSPRFAMANFARQLGEMAAGGAEPVLRVGNLSPRRDYLDARDVVRAYRTLMERGEPGGAYNVAAGEAPSLAEMVEEMVALSGTNARVEVDPERVRPVDVPLVCGDAAKLRALGWAPRIPLRETLRDLLASMRPAEDRP